MSSQSSSHPPASGVGDVVDDADRRLLDGLRGGDEASFAALVERYHPLLLRVIGFYVKDRAVGEEVAQETWLAVLQGLARFEERSSLKTWIFRIGANKAKTRGVREDRSLPFSALTGDEDSTAEATVDASLFFPTDDPDRPGRWASAPSSWRDIPEERLLAKETLGKLHGAIAQLPPAQRTVIRLRDVEGWSAREVCDALELSDAYQRVLLHRARARVRAQLAVYLGAQRS